MKMTLRKRQPKLKLVLALWICLGLVGCIDEKPTAEPMGPLAVYETDWPQSGASKGKTQGPIQFRYRLEEVEGGKFTLHAFARTSLRNVGPWSIELIGTDLPKLDSDTTVLQKSGQQSDGQSIHRQFSFKLDDLSQEWVSLRVAVTIGNQKVAKTFKVKLGPISTVVVETCEVGVTCERELKGATSVRPL